MQTKQKKTERPGFFYNLHCSINRRRFNMGRLKDALAVIVGLAALAFGIYKFYLFVTTPGSEQASHDMWWAIGAAVIFFVCGLIYFLGHVNKEEEIHITQ